MYLSDLSDQQLSVLYYKNNMMEFIEDHDEIKELILTIFESIDNLDYVDTKDINWEFKVDDEYSEEFYKSFKGKTAKDYNKFVNKQYFMDPNDPPKKIIAYLDILKEYMMKYVYCRYLVFDRIYRLKNFQRKVVTVIDTDSNILSLDTIVNYIFENVIEGRTFGRDVRNNEFILVNILCYILTAAVTDILLTYGEYSNIPEEYRPIYNMKNEFYFEILVIGSTKKRYISKIVLREGNLMNPPKSDVKGFDLKKSSTSEAAEEYYMNLINKYIIYADQINVRGMIKDLQKFQDRIKESILKGEKTFLPNGSVKEMGAYKDPSTNQSVKATLAWNILCPDQMIEIPAKVSLVKLNIFNEEDIEDLKTTEPEKYQLIIDKIFNDKTGMFVKIKNEPIEKVKDEKNWWLKIPQKYRSKYKEKGIKEWNNFVEEMEESGADMFVRTINKQGLQTIAIPSNTEIPFWLQPYIDYGTMINNILSPFEPVLRIFKVRTLEEGRTIKGVNRKTEAISNIIKF